MPRGAGPIVPATHIYRHLLREATYLPPTCQPFLRAHIRARFRKHHHDPPLPNPATKLRLRRARHDIRYLWAANHGLLANMTRIILLAFGRLGKRRRALIAQFVAKREPESTAELAEQLANEISARNDDDTLHPRRPRDWLDEWDLPKFHALAASQAKRSFWSPRSSIKGHRLDPIEALPRENPWGRPLAAKVVRSKLRKWYKAQVHRLMPPLGADEWERLRLLATGQADRSLWQMPKRRPAGVSMIQDETTKPTWDWQRYATEAVRSIERGSSRAAKARTGEQGEAPYGLGPAIGLHSYDRARFWRRLYTRVWEMTPKMAEKENMPGKWTVEWGQTMREVPVATKAQMSFFEGAVVARVKKGRSRYAKAYTVDGDAPGKPPPKPQEVGGGGGQEEQKEV
ncbi:hypothetical protein BD289DRAFT_371310 [Coniella lustricola]|uniref:LYR motif-containing protein Cup1-like N-terminal domain-containing protein n=1 Tax=Coniella lustricola TaxID=2025994 RepID=A0A2T3A3W8_9PEZI|nr:hypothetical protein BD289DRAFT_371310 [Coniella lustricola]